MADKFAGKCAVITGGSTGIGLAAAKRFVQEGMDHVFMIGRRKDALDRAVAEIGRGVTAVQGDVASLSDLDHLYDEVRKQNRKIDVIFANAGIAQLAPFGTVDEKFYDLHFDANVKGIFFTVQKALPYLNDNASIILNTSVAGQKGLANASVYSATKAALRSLARTFAGALAARNIRVNAVAPGPIETPIFGRTGLSKEAIDDFAKNIVSMVPMQRLGKPEEVAGVVAFLASADASYVTGVEINVDGGMGQI